MYLVEANISYLFVCVLDSDDFFFSQVYS